jgi:predicted amidohydrolase
MREPLVVAVAQPPCLAHDVAANARAHAAAIRAPEAAGARVVVFPELSLTGYELDAAPVDPGDERLQPLIQACADTGATAIVGAPVSDNSNKSADNSKNNDNSKTIRKGKAGRDFIGVLAIDGHGASVAYRKMWLG